MRFLAAEPVVRIYAKIRTRDFRLKALIKRKHNKQRYFLVLLTQSSGAVHKYRAVVMLLLIG